MNGEAVIDIQTLKTRIFEKTGNKVEDDDPYYALFFLVQELISANSASVHGAVDKIDSTFKGINPDTLAQFLTFRDNLAGTLEELNVAANLFETRVKAGTARALDEAAVKTITDCVANALSQAGLNLVEFQKAAQTTLQFSNVLEKKISDAVAKAVAEKVAEILPVDLEVMAQKAGGLAAQAAVRQSAEFYAKIDSRVGEVLADLQDTQPAPWWKSALRDVGLVTSGVLLAAVLLKVVAG